MTNQEILQKCTEHLHSFQPIRSVSVIAKSKKGVDACIKIDADGTRDHYNVEIKSVLKRPLPAYLYDQTKFDKKSVILMSAYINPSIAQELKKAGIQYIDVSGNAYLKLGRNIHIEIEGKKSDRPIRTESSSLFQPKLMQLLSIFLIDSESVNQTVRDLASRSGISKDRVSTGLRLLKKQAWLIQTAKKRYKFVNKQKLFEQWLMNYGERLRPKLILGAYKIAPSIEKDLEYKLKELTNNQSCQYAFTGSSGAAKLMSYYRGKTTEVFIPYDMVNTVRKSLKLLQSQEPNVTLFKLFSPDIVYQNNGVAHPLFIYAELMYHGGDREQETARLIYNQFMKNMIE